MDEHGYVSRLNDNNLQTDSLNGPTGSQPSHYCWSEPCFHWCYLKESIEIDRVTLYPPQNNWRFYRTTDIKVEMYESVEFAVSNYTETNVNYTMLDAATLGPMVYSKDHISMTSNTTINITRIVTDENSPVQVTCPYRYALSCDALLDAECHGDPGYKSWRARYAEYNTVDNSELYWMCINDSHLTADLLNYKMDYYTTDSSERDVYFWLNSGTATTILEECSAAYIVESVQYQCTVNGDGVSNDDLMKELGELSGGEMIECRVNVSNAVEDMIVFDQLGWAISIIATESTYNAYPVASATTVNKEEGIVLTTMTVPQCDGEWSMQFVVDQSPIGGQKHLLWSLGGMMLSGGHCEWFGWDSMLELIDIETFEEKFVEVSGVSLESMLEHQSGGGGTDGSGVDENSAKALVWGIVVGLSCVCCVVGMVAFYFWIARKRGRRSVFQTAEINIGPTVHSKRNVNQDVSVSNIVYEGSAPQWGTVPKMVPVPSGPSGTPERPSSTPDSGTKIKYAADSAVPHSNGTMGEIKQCQECGQTRAGMIDDVDGLFYCNVCWAAFSAH